jgi:hypothetical protein
LRRGELLQHLVVVGQAEPAPVLEYEGQTEAFCRRENDQRVGLLARAVQPGCAEFPLRESPFDSSDIRHLVVAEP